LAERAVRARRRQSRARVLSVPFSPILGDDLVESDAPPEPQHAPNPSCRTEWMRRARRQGRVRRLLPFALVALLALTLLPGLAAVDALDEREARDLVTAYESTERTDWLSPVYAHEPSFEKPLPGYAPEVVARRLLRRLVPASVAGTGDVAVSRAVRALLAAALAFTVAMVGTSLFGARAGWLAACALASMVGLPLAARADGCQVYATLLAWLGHGRMLNVLTGRTRTPAATLMLGWLALGAAAFTGGPLPALWPLAGFALYFALARHHAGWKVLDPAAGVLIVCGVCLPWYGVMAAIHGLPFLSHVPWFPYGEGVRGAWYTGLPLALSFAVVASFPWTPLLAAALADAAMRLRRSAAPRTRALPLDTEHAEHLLIAMTLAGALPVALYPGPPLTAALPALPAVALLVGRFVDRVLDGEGETAALTQATRLLAVIGTAFSLAGLALAARVAVAAPGLRLLSAVVFLSAWAPLLADVRGLRRLAVALFALPAALGAPVLLARVVPALEPWLNARSVAETMQRVSPPFTPLVVFEPPPPSLRESLPRNFVARARILPGDADITARDGYVYAAYRPANERAARAAFATLSAVPEVLARTPVLVLVRVRAAPALAP
jgi:4-amino-4-deoxy-L-arabinose transferase-like glycosyltransferase